MSTTTGERVTWAALYSSETRGWSAKTTADVSTSTVDPHSYMEIKPSILIGGALYFTLELHKVILKYDLARQGLSVMDASEVYERMGIAIITEDGGLGFAAIKGNNLHLWSWLTGDDNSCGMDTAQGHPTSESSSSL